MEFFIGSIGVGRLIFLGRNFLGGRLDIAGMESGIRYDRALLLAEGF